MHITPQAAEELARLGNISSLAELGRQVREAAEAVARKIETERAQAGKFVKEEGNDASENSV